MGGGGVAKSAHVVNDQSMASFWRRINNSSAHHFVYMGTIDTCSMRLYT